MELKKGGLFVCASLLAAAVASAPAGMPARAASPASDDRTIIHVLNRVGFGPRPGDIERVRHIGLRRFIEQQLHPEQMADEGLPGRLAHLRSVGMSSREISVAYERPLLEARRNRKEATDAGNPPMARPPAAGGDSDQRRASTVVTDLSEQKLLRAVYSERQLEEVLTDFWFNHFNVDARKGRVRFLLTEYEREAIRPHVLGTFRDLLEATAKSPAMLFYLDNWMSAGPDARAVAATGGRFVPGPRAGRARGRSAAVPRQPAAQTNRGRRGLNENYARELMELHTLGVDGGYTQKDVTEVARAFTGWTIENPRTGGGFRFEPRMHDSAEKTVLGHRLTPGGGVAEGEQVLDILASHPSTARFIATKLARRFVSDAPPSALVDRMAARFGSTGGDLREVMRTLLTSPEFMSPEAYRAKVKTPFEFVVGAIRSTGAQVTDARPLIRTMQELGMPLYQCQPPTGYKDTADAWANTGALVGRMNFALSLSSRSDMAGVQAGVHEAIGYDLSEATRTTIAKATTAAQAVALTLGSPEFQRR